MKRAQFVISRPPNPAVTLGAAPLTTVDLVAVARGAARVEIAPATRRRIAAMRSKVDALLESGKPIYGVNTGFGALAEVPVAAADLGKLQLNLVRSHATGVGDPYPVEIARAMMLLRANVLCLGTSGVRPEVPELLVGLLNAGITPFIPQKGSVGASGDLAPLAHLALVLIGEGEVLAEGRRRPSTEALAAANLEPVVLAAKEGLALINGTQAMTADGALAADRARNLCKNADIAGAMSLEALKGTSRAFDPRIQAARGHPGQIASAANLRALTADSGIMASHAECGRVQDPYSLRCMPQVHGATRDVLDFVSLVLVAELNAATDNPLVFEDDDGELELISGGNFHGQPVAFACDFLAIATAELANIAERRIEQLVNPHLSAGLPPFLTQRSGLCSGFMIAQVTAAALVSENKVLAHPASVDSIPSSANREDHVSMGALAARKARFVVEHTEQVLAIELLCAAQGIDLRRPLVSSAGVEAAWRVVRQSADALDDDRILHHDIEAITACVRDGRMLAAVEAAVGPLQ